MFIEIRSGKYKVRAKIRIFVPVIAMDTVPLSSAACAAFTGHRTYRHEADELLRRTIAMLHAAGICTFLSGMAVGFDLAAAEAVLSCKAAHADLRLVAVVSFRGQQQRFSAHDRARFERILAEADETLFLSESYSRGSYAIRNNYLIAHAATLVTWYDGTAGGTRYTVERARAQNRKLIHLHPATPLSAYPVPELFR